ncbi:phosphoethanolamine transferase [Aureimonas phyllosphaerae]|uniref:Lipid A ethanolaminephosphotransferase n=1 Tax=Aureimonas phyllosphaerae TaxID=1166078 RepID=A0A7W6C0M1_9HYPH|nr:phosphoethanolamine--lipid A transferase [Aureimonas phyllosphaerae]MBB3937211.1 lipid A ethanolaminephosphotransferase [Aureimonas phyllosphaerae]MBB3961152.1 lipid A ethanolaminephosphotransferase [Aureimonas phyllosphaerae]SFF49034.1 phosphatidylethanolamine:Kdo2-lipid A phosphoethanolamine transferase [Aureimonas phyllosphaerae]
MRLARPTIGSLTLAALATAYLLFALNGTFWRKGLLYFTNHPLHLAALGIGLFLLMFSILAAVSLRFLLKPLVIALILISAVASYYVDSYGILIDRDMITNVAETTTAEAGHLLTAGFVLHLVLFGLVPAALVAVVRVRHRPFWQKARRNLALILPSLALTVAIVLTFYSSYASTFRTHRDLMASLNPVAPVTALVKYAQHWDGETVYVVAPLGTDAVPGPRLARAQKPVVAVLVVGETARGQQFSLNGYEKDTNPELKARGVVSFSDVSSCGTSTAVSVPCMFSNLTRAGHSDEKARSVENLLDVVKRAGFDVRWIDNDTGAYHVADRVPYTYLPDTADPRFCEGGECRDEILTDRLDAELKTVTGNTLIVLHQLGSHGPTYFKRYPQAFERFTPACQTAEFANCRREEIVNAYDNTILYTDHNLAETIDRLKARTDLDTTMLYLSDHGESLGENGIYLHAMPYILAPSTQTHVPMIAWFSDGFARTMGIDARCLAGRRDAPLSHDNLFHTMLGLADVKTGVYDTALDAFAPCRTPAAPSQVSDLGGQAR